MTDTPIAATEGGLLSTYARIDPAAEKGRFRLTIYEGGQAPTDITDIYEGPLVFIIRFALKHAVPADVTALATRAPSPCSLGEDVVELVRRVEAGLTLAGRLMCDVPCTKQATDTLTFAVDALAALSALRPVQEEGK